MSGDWESAYREGDTPWDKGQAAPPLVEFLKTQKISGRVLVPGCGLGHDVRLIAEQGAEVLGMDIAASAVARAAAIERVGKESYELGDFLNLPRQYCESYDWVVEHTCLCALDPELRRSYVAGVVRALKPGGYYLAVFYRNVPDYDGDGPPHPISEEDIKALFGAQFSLINQFVPTLHYPSRPLGSEQVCLFQRRS